MGPRRDPARKSSGCSRGRLRQLRRRCPMSACSGQFHAARFGTESASPPRAELCRSSTRRGRCCGGFNPYGSPDLVSSVDGERSADQIAASRQRARHLAPARLHRRALFPRRPSREGLGGMRARRRRSDRHQRRWLMTRTSLALAVAGVFIACSGQKRPDPGPEPLSPDPLTAPAPASGLSGGVLVEPQKPPPLALSVELRR